ncbi:hypothetical protein N9018_03590 [Rhodopirellula sp.]|nr:hypothetical protein [Rhodopirellula sp.]
MNTVITIDLWGESRHEVGRAEKRVSGYNGYGACVRTHRKIFQLRVNHELLYVT